MSYLSTEAVFEYVASVRWWQWLLLVIFIGLAFAAYVMYRGYARIKPKPLENVPIPPLTHPVLGHPDKMLHPLKHELRLEVCDAARACIHQLVVMNHASIFINDAGAAHRVIEECPSKGRIYSSFRFDPNIPDMLACDGEAYEQRKLILEPPLEGLKLKEGSILFDNLLSIFGKHVDSGAVLDIKRLYTLFAFDCVCETVFDYKLDAINDSEDGIKMLQSLQSLADAQAGTGVYPSPNARKVPPEELVEAKASWRAVLNKLKDHAKESAKKGKGKGATNYNQALVNMSEAHEDFNDPEMLSEIHQVLRHGHETIAGTLCWLTYAVYKTKNVRETLEKSILAHPPTPADPYPEYLELVLKEAMRRFPVAGNMTVRTAHNPGEVTLKITEMNSTEAPVGVPLHVHMYSLQNTNKEWKKPKEFKPERWVGEEAPKCPFMSSSSTKKTTNTNTSAAVDAAYDGVGFREESLAFFPFSVGERSCSAKGFALQIFRKFLFGVSSKYRLNPYESFWEDDCGVSLNATIVPVFEKATMIKVRRVVAGQIEEEEGGEEEGWAAED